MQKRVSLFAVLELYCARVALSPLPHTQTYLNGAHHLEPDIYIYICIVNIKAAKPVARKFCLKAKSVTRVLSARRVLVIFFWRKILTPSSYIFFFVVLLLLECINYTFFERVKKKKNSITDVNKAFSMLCVIEKKKLPQEKKN